MIKHGTLNLYLENLHSFADFSADNYFPLIDPIRYPLKYFVLKEKRNAPLRSYKDDFVPEINERRYNYSFSYVD